MLVMCRLVKGFRKVAPLVLITPLILTACGNSDPTPTQAGQTLKNHILLLLKERNAQNVMILDPGGKDIPCPDGQSKQTFAATGADTAQDTSPSNMRSALLGALGRVASYKVVDVGSMTNPIKVVNDSTRTRLVLDSPASGMYKISGETDCLAP